MGLITADQFKAMPGLRSGGGSLSEEVNAVRNLQVGEAYHFDSVVWVMDTKTGKAMNAGKNPADKLANRLSTDAHKQGYKVRTRKVLDDKGEKANGLVVLRIEPDTDNDNDEE
jgi:hypothetical protein